MAKKAKKSPKKAAGKTAKKATPSKKEAPEVEATEAVEETKGKKSTKKSKSGGAFATFEKVKELILSIDAEFVKFDNGTKAAAKRIRKNAMEIKRAMGDLRKQISEEVSKL